jgi:hypothetical protein
LAGDWYINNAQISNGQHIDSGTNLDFKFVRRSGTNPLTCIVTYTGNASATLTLTNSGNTWEGNQTFLEGNYTIALEATDQTNTIQVSASVSAANPIPVPTLIMPEEYINVTLFSADGTWLAKVNGTYPFKNINYTMVTMDYPVPPNATNISVEMNETRLSWTYNTKTYSTVIGDWPMINWTISPTPQNFTVKTYYENPLPLIGKNCTFFYAMGTGRYLETYAKETTAYVRILMETNYTDLHVYTVGNVSGGWTWKTADCIINREDTTDMITLNVTSQPLAPLGEDLLLTFQPYTLRGVGVVNVATSKKGGIPAPTVGRGYDVNVTAKVVNYGVNDENSGLAIYANATLVQPKTNITLAAGSSATITVIWNTSGFAYGNHTITATVDPVPNETNTTDNTLAGDWIIVTMPGDLNGDFKVSLQDLTILAADYGSRPGDARWNPNADIIGNGVVGLSDLSTMAIHYGQHYP